MKLTTPLMRPRKVEIVKREIDDSSAVATGLDVQHDDQSDQIGRITGRRIDAMTSRRCSQA
ncbi:hypothetical protein [Nocardia asiatica]|uniref:hypothetical protein n=1 Tax=Nocardia asiatica TaxID=209252 RepID=UPI003EE3AC6F